MHRVEIRVKDHLDKNWEDWIEGFTIIHSEQNETVLTGCVPDQAALFGLMSKLRDLGVVLLSANFGEEKTPEGG